MKRTGSLCISAPLRCPQAAELKETGPRYLLPYPRCYPDRADSGPDEQICQCTSAQLELNYRSTAKRLKRGTLSSDRRLPLRSRGPQKAPCIEG